MPCPICQKGTVPRYRPFCSKRCADIDLGRWLNGSYRVEGKDEDDAANEPGPSEPPITH